MLESDIPQLYPGEHARILPQSNRVDKNEKSQAQRLAFRLKY
jgi:hypothetical protein